MREFKAKSSKFFFARSSFGTKAVASWQLQVPSELWRKGQSPPQILTGIKGKPATSKDLGLLLVHLDFQTFLRPCAIDGLWARLFWHLWMHVVFDSPADPTNLNKKESCSCSISPQSETCLPTTRHLFALCFRKMPVVEVCHMSTHKIWIQIHSTSYYVRDAGMEFICTRLEVPPSYGGTSIPGQPPENSANEIWVYSIEQIAIEQSWFWRLRLARTVQCLIWRQRSHRNSGPNFSEYLIYMTF